MKNRESNNYPGFSDVGIFQLPKKIFAGHVPIIFEGKEYTASLISDESRQCANDFFFKDGAKLKMELFNFIEKRLNNDCIIANLGGYIESNNNKPVLIGRSKSIRYDALCKIFSRAAFAHGSCVEIKK